MLDIFIHTHNYQLYGYMGRCVLFVLALQLGESSQLLASGCTRRGFLLASVALDACAG